MTRTAYIGAAVLGAVALVLGAMFHLTGLSFVEAEASKSENGFFKNAVTPVWIFASVHWFAFATIVGVNVARPSSQARLTLLVIAVAVIVDAAIAYNALGPFAGAFILAAAGVFFLIAAALR